MKEENNQQLIDSLYAELRVLNAELLSGEYGDWKVAKSYEYQLAGLEIPYDVNELHTQRQNMRDHINEIREELKELEK